MGIADEARKRTNDRLKQPREPKPAPEPKLPRKGTKLGKSATLSCDLCGRSLVRNSKGSRRVYKHEIWCQVCLHHHRIYPDRCETCDGYHLPPGESVLDPTHDLTDVLGNLR